MAGPGEPKVMVWGYLQGDEETRAAIDKELQEIAEARLTGKEGGFLARFEAWQAQRVAEEAAAKAAKRSAAAKKAAATRKAKALEKKTKSAKTAKAAAEAASLPPAETRSQASKSRGKPRARTPSDPA